MWRSNNCGSLLMTRLVALLYNTLFSTSDLVLLSRRLRPLVSFVSLFVVLYYMRISRAVRGIDSCFFVFPFLWSSLSDRPSPDCNGRSDIHWWRSLFVLCCFFSHHFGRLWVSSPKIFWLPLLRCCIPSDGVIGSVSFVSFSFAVRSGAARSTCFYIY